MPTVLFVSLRCCSRFGTAYLIELCAVRRCRCDPGGASKVATSVGNWEHNLSRLKVEPNVRNESSRQNVTHRRIPPFAPSSISLELDRAAHLSA
jgi:hypothetical protein